MHNPTLIPALLRDTSVNKGLIYKELRKALPCRIGIEFEMGASFLKGFQSKYNQPKATDKEMQEHYGVLETRSDNSSVTLNQALTRRDRVRRQPDDPFMDEHADGADPDGLIETRVSIKDYSQLVGLYKFMQDLPEFCTLHEGGGIHIHIDMSMFPYENTNKEKEIHKWITHRLNEVGNLFPIYKGKYNKKVVGIRAKSTWVNISRLHTLEFRTPPLTFDYYTLMSWIVGIVKFRNKLIHECRLRSKLPAKNIAETINQLITDLNEMQCNPPVDNSLDGYITIADNNTSSGTYWTYTHNGSGNEWTAEPR